MPTPPPEHPLWHGHAGQPTGVQFDWASGKFSDGYKPTSEDWAKVGVIGVKDKQNGKR